MAERLFAFGERDIERVGRATLAIEGLERGRSGVSAAGPLFNRFLTVQIKDDSGPAYPTGMMSEACGVRLTGNGWESDENVTYEVDATYLIGTGFPGERLLCVPGPGREVLAVLGGVTYMRGTWDESEETVTSGLWVIENPFIPFGSPSADGVTVGCIWNQQSHWWDIVFEECE